MVSLDDLTRSSTAKARGLDNTPTPEAMRELEHLLSSLLRPLEMKLGASLVVNSGYRAPQVNAAVGGTSNSQHVKGQAADIECPGLSNKELSGFIQRSGLEFDQLIEEYLEDDVPSAGWVHVSLRGDGKNRRQVLFVKRKRAARS